jgi:hypothetical protein
MSAEELIALVLDSCARLAPTRHDHYFRSAGIAFYLDDLFSAMNVRAYSEATSLAGFGDVLILPRPAGHVNNTVRDCAWHLQQRPEPLPFIFVDNDSFSLSDQPRCCDWQIYWRASFDPLGGRRSGARI